MQISLKRVYEPKTKADGVRILVERLWPRGMTKAAAGVDHWPKDVAPSPDLRAWYQHDEGKWIEFKRRYLAELRANRDGVAELKALIAGRRATFLFAARDAERCSARVLKDYLEKQA